MNIDRWLAVLGLVGTVIGLWLAWHFYIKTIRAKVLAIAYTKPVSLMLPVYELKATYHGKKTTQLSRVFVLLWNKGTAPIETTDFIAPIEIRSHEKVLALEIHSKDAAADISLDEEKRTLSIELLRPGEAIVLKIDAADEAYQPDISVQMKSADMSVPLRSQRAVIPQLVAGVGAVAATWIVLAVAKAVGLLEVEEAFGWNLAKFVGIIVVLFGAMALAIFSAHRAATKIVALVTPGIPHWFFRHQMTCERIHDAWQRVRDEIHHVVAVG